MPDVRHKLDQMSYKVTHTFQLAGQLPNETTQGRADVDAQPETWMLAARSLE
jgi:hypothetical protein